MEPTPFQQQEVVAVSSVNARTALYELALEAGGVGTFDWDLVTGRLVWDERLIRLFGYDPETFDESITAFTSRLHPDDLPTVEAQMRRAIETVGVYDAEYRLVLPDGGQRWVGAHGQAVPGPDGRAVRLIGAAYDTTARRTAEAQITSVLESMATAFLAVDAEWRFTYVNAEATRVLGATREQLLGRVLWDVFPATRGSEFERRYREVMATGDPATFEAYYPEPLNAWYEVRASRSPDGLAVYFVDVTVHKRLQRDAESAARRAALLSSITERLVGTLDHREAADRLAHLLVPTLADWCIVTLVDDTASAGSRQGLRSIAAQHRDPQRQAVVEEYATIRLAEMTDDEVVRAVMELGRAHHIERDAAARIEAMFGATRARDLMAELAPEAVLVLPLTGPTGPVGMVSIANGAERGDFSAPDLVTAEHVAARAGLVLDNARLYRQQRELAETLQHSMLSAPIDPDNGEIVARYLPAGEGAQVGGDWYDAFLQDDGATVVTIGDVSGHDIAAAATMGQLRSVLRGVAVSTGAGPAAVMRGVDHAMTTLQISTTATAVIGRLEQPADALPRLRWSNAGHPPPLLIDPDGTVSWLEAPRPEMLLGLRWEAPRTESERVLEPGSTLLLYTDGLIERRDEHIDTGLARLRAVTCELGPDLVGGRITLDTFCDDVLARMIPDPLQDDIALLAVRPAVSPRTAVT